MSDGMSGWERMLADQAAELEKLREAVTEHQARLQGMQAVLRDKIQLREALRVEAECSVLLRGALRIVRDRIVGTIAEGWLGADYPGTLLEHVNQALGETESEGKQA